MMTFSIVIILLTLFASLAISQPVISLSQSKMINDSQLAHIFHHDIKESILQIDFDIIKDVIETVNVLKNGEIVRDADVSEVPNDTLFELDLQRLSRGNYHIELVTNTHRITKEIAIN